MKNHLLIIGYVWPEPNSSAAGSRIMQLIELFQSQQWEITYASAAADSEYMFDVTRIGIQKISIALNNSSFDVFIKQLQPTMVIFDRFMMEEQYGWRVAENCPNAIRILDTIDLHCLRTARQKAWKENRTMTLADLSSDMAKREVAAILRSDISLMISEVEIQLLQDHYKVDVAVLYYLPFLLDPISEAEIKSWNSFETRVHFITIGNFLHEPNWNAVQFLKEEIWSFIRKELPTAELHIYGAYASQKVNELHQPKEGFYIKGRAEDAKTVVEKARVCLAPLRFGAGIKGKLVEAMQCGTPSVTTDIGAESMHSTLPWNGIVANDAETIAMAAVKLYTDEIFWKQCQYNGITIIKECYSKKIEGEKLLLHISKITNTLEQHRLNNFPGAMLMHHTLSATKYMSKWIEEKNKSLPFASLKKII